NIVFQKLFGTGPALAHPLAVPRITAPSTWTSRLLPYQHFAWGLPPASEAVPIPQSFATPRYRFVVLHTPGHSDDHICLLEPNEGWLFGGDLFLSENVQVLRRDEDAGQILASLRRLLDYDIKVIFCASGRVVTEGKKALVAKIAYWEELAKEACRLKREGLQPEEIRDVLLGEEGAMYSLTAGDFGKIHLINSLLQNFCPA
ncbi:MBL fold metallo-hydrolase, partial [Desulfovirgula thermocuniculi]|uniref:MBL fold metallo-hydrolase n=1 Tax=Desulfovirgula thermocuniculi TaxID=348842 RepID=UPI000485B94A